VPSSILESKKAAKVTSFVYALPCRELINDLLAESQFKEKEGIMKEQKMRQEDLKSRSLWKGSIF